MKAKYYLRGMGVGIVVTALIFLIVSFFYTPSLSEDQIILEAKKLGMTMEEEDTEKDSGKTSGDTGQSTEDKTSTKSDAGRKAQDDTGEGTESETKNPDGTVTTTTESEDGTEVSETKFEPENIAVTVAVGETPAILAADLKAKGLIEDEKSFVDFLGSKGYAEFLQPGDYEISTGSSFREIAVIVTQNKVQEAGAETE